MLFPDLVAFTLRMECVNVGECDYWQLVLE